MQHLFPRVRRSSVRTRRLVASGVGLALAASSLSLLATSPAQAADSVDLRLLNINDFHGRIDANTTAFATTIEQERAEAGEDNTLLLSAGDNIGASLFASSTQQDQPTIDVLNALGLKTSAVGNHEFDKGFDDLTGRVSDAADWDYLGANVYEKGTTTPALPEYATFEVAGLTVGVIGTVTEETPSLVSPAGIADLDFGDPVEATNRVADQLTDGDESNGEADVIVAEYHEGASEGTPDGATLEDEIAAGGAFADIVENTSSAVDVIFTGHTHKEYAWDAPIPGEDDATRPVLQTGSYGENVGEVDLTVDPDTGDVSAYTQQNVARVAAEDLSYSRVAEVKTITDDALDYAAEVGNQKVGEITADITTAYLDGSRDDRSAESALGDLVANALRDGVSDFADPDLGITNPGGLRAELFYAGDTTDNEENTDGVVTYAEANAVLPFNNTVAIVTLTGAQIKDVLEQQWQPADSSRPYLQLALSDNVRVTADSSAPEGERITSIRLDGEEIDPSASYTVSTLSFLATGGDNFTAFTEGSYVDTGLIDADMWYDYLGDNSPIAPDFARQQVFTDTASATLTAGATNTLTLGPDQESPTYPFTGETLDMASLGAPTNTEVVATGTTSGGDTVALGTFEVTSGTAAISVDVPASLAGGSIDFVATESGTTVTYAVAEAESVTPTLKVKAPAVAAGTNGKVTVKVTAAGATPTGTVTITKGSTELGSAAVKSGVATVRISSKTLAPGSYSLKAAYSGDDSVAAGSTTFTLKVGKAAAKIAIIKPGKVVAKKTRATLKVKVTGFNGKAASGKVTVRVAGQTKTVKLVKGVAEAKLAKIKKAGKYKVVVRYLGDDATKTAGATSTLRVVRK
ncbi:MAG: 5'-nucleotidase C-terminal domain-containing protein [Nocardioides sp.]|uniref:5'-nucleotidase C-terminal domain-containing protein n=1 Tax=Nocardioides sp. TaxID=35761 RepID=UPI0039E5053A